MISIPYIVYQMESESMWEKYSNMLLCFEEYRKYTIFNKYNREKFSLHMNDSKYVIHLMWAPSLNKFVYVVLFHSKSLYVSKTDMFRKFLNIFMLFHKQQESIKKKHMPAHKDQQPIHIFMITKQELSKNLWKSISQFNTKLHVENYLHKHFLIEISKGPLCSRHTILTKQEAIDLCAKQLKTAPHNLQVILPTDPHVIWSGAQIGDILRIEIYSELAGKCIRYREVSAHTGKVISGIFDDEVEEYIEPIGEEEEVEEEEKSEISDEEKKEDDDLKDIESEDDFSDY